MSCFLKVGHKDNRDKVTNMQRIRCGVKANIEAYGTCFKLLSDFFFIGALGNNATCFKFVKDVHRYHSFIK